MLAILIVVAEFEALVVFVAPMFSKFVALDAEVVVASHRRCIVGAAVEAELAAVASVFAFVAIAALIADEVVAVIVVLRTNAMLAMLLAVRTESAVFAELSLVEAIAAIRADMVVKVRTIGTEFVFAMIVFLAACTQSTILALLILRTLPTLRTEVVFIVGRSYAVAMPAAFRLAVFVAATLAKSAVIAKVEASAFGTLATLPAFPFVVFATENAVVASVCAPLDFVAKAMAAFRTVFLAFSTALAKSAFAADVLVAHKTFATVNEVFGSGICHAGIADGVVFAGIAPESISVFAVDDKANAAYRALQFTAVFAVML